MNKKWRRFYYLQRKTEEQRLREKKARPHLKRAAAHLTDHEVRELRRLYSQGSYSYQQLADKFGVTKPTAIRAIKRQTYKWVE